MAKDFEYHPVYSVSFVSFLFLCAFFGLPILFFPVLPLLVLSTTLHDRYVRFMMGTWFRSVAGFLEIIYGMKVKVTGDQFPKDENCVIVMNHRTQMDWIVLWSYLSRRGEPSFNKICLKNILKFIPGAGWAMQQALFLFLLRNWEDDKHHFYRLLTYYKNGKRPYQFLFFPEGTDYCLDTKRSSNAFAKKNDMPPYEYVLHPRTKGFAEAVDALRGSVKSVIDITVGYPSNVPEGFRSLAFGNYPHEVNFHARHYSIDSLPQDNGELQNWCRRVWAEKEAILTEFHQNGQFQGDVLEDCSSLRPRMLVCLILWLLLIAVTVTATLLSSWYRWLVLVCCVVYALISVFGGLEKVILAADDRLHQPSSNS
eukprot:m.26969 g.26969  ORF g.26969 m.26969 type:complete len:368 (+) comp29611_c0_seq4:18-1121(+)